jgi:hypothetical protein
LDDDSLILPLRQSCLVIEEIDPLTGRIGILVSKQMKLWQFAGSSGPLFVDMHFCIVSLS